VGVALTASSLAFGAVTATAAKKPAPIHVSCTTTVGVMIADNQSGVTPPVQQGAEYGSAACGRPLGQGVQADKFNVADSGDTVANYRLYFPIGTIHGTYDLTPQESQFNFLEVDYLGTLKVTGGTGAFTGAKGAGTMTCRSLDGIHTTCKDKLKLKQL
jgi:hypothetical protein